MEYETLKKYVDDNLSTRKIAKELSISQGTVKYWLKKHGLKTQPYPEGYSCKYCGESDEDKMMRSGNGNHAKRICKKCHNERTKERQRENIRLATEYKGGKCERCGYDKCINALEFHHRNPHEKTLTTSL